MGDPVQYAKSDAGIEKCFDVMSALRTAIRRENFVPTIRKMQDDGYHLAYIENEGEVVAVAGFRIGTNLVMGRNLYIDDLVTAGTSRSRGYGKQMLQWLRKNAIERGCNYIHLDSAVERSRAHKFYFSHGYSIAAHHFVEKLNG